MDKLTSDKLTSDKLTSDKLTSDNQIIQHLNDNGIWYYVNKNNRRQFYINQNKQIWDKSERVAWYASLSLFKKIL